MTDRGSATGDAGTDVMPAPSRCDVVREELMRRVGRLPPARADPIAVLDSRADTVCTPVAIDAEDDPADDTEAVDGWAGVPQMLQYPSSIVPVHPGCVQCSTAAVIALLRLKS
jgi:hypothetical protein